MISFTGNGRRLERSLAHELEKEGHQVLQAVKCKELESDKDAVKCSAREWTGEQFRTRDVLIFIGAVQIAVRLIASFIGSKTTDPAVLVLDEKGQYCIPILSGHIGGANEMAERIAEMAGALPVITTATDIRGKWAIDVFARKNHLYIEDMQKAKQISAKILEEWENKELPARIHLFQGLPKGDKMELIIQKAVELGAYRVVPVSMKRSVVKLDAKKADAKRKRWNAVSESAAKQSKRSLIPEVAPLMTYKEAVKEAAGYDMVLLPYESADGIRKTRELLASVKPGTDIAVFIGPEGGFEDEEVELARENGAEIVTLGKRILRTETAGLCMLSALMLQLEV